LVQRGEADVNANMPTRAVVPPAEPPITGGVRVYDVNGGLVRVISPAELAAREVHPVPKQHAPIMGPHSYPWSTVAAVRRTRRV
jgi:hypothetical protein